MRCRAASLMVPALLLLTPMAGHAALSAYTQNFETLQKTDPNALGNNGWLVYGNVYNPTHTTYLYGYGPYPAPNGTSAFCAIDTLQGGPLQGSKQLSVYSDYNNTGAQGAGDQVESNVYREQTIADQDVGHTWTLQFDAKLGNLVSPSTAAAFIKTLNPANGYQITNFISLDMSAIPATWNTYTINITVDASLVGQLLQIGFLNTATSFRASGVFYDNINWYLTQAEAVDGAAPMVLDLRPASPNPSRATTRMEYTMASRGLVDLSVFDVAGRHVATLASGVVEAGSHSVTWNGRYDNLEMAPSGLYKCVLRTTEGLRTRSVVRCR